ncbi:hypothetical protein RGU11_06595 [Rossellomorea marisflavi]|uniref:hypothetical protein n=1 Tax=Rossellomorea marisflavi TaxID=189381 RepID=UPI0028534D3A|nr:hypothetical protein [Rossellomorea marisflavi]MDR4936034.1 hypothetical protein [Rossellomorea marisflavi]
MSVWLKWIGILTIGFAVVTSVYILNIELLVMKWAYSLGVLLLGSLFGLIAVLVARIYDNIIPADHENERDIAKKRRQAALDQSNF